MGKCQISAFNLLGQYQWRKVKCLPQKECPESLVLELAIWMLMEKEMT